MLYNMQASEEYATKAEELNTKLAARCLDQRAAELFESLLWTAVQHNPALENLIPVLIALRVQAALHHLRGDDVDWDACLETAAMLLDNEDEGLREACKTSYNGLRQAIHSARTLLRESAGAETNASSRNRVLQIYKSSRVIHALEAAMRCLRAHQIIQTCLGISGEAASLEEIDMLLQADWQYLRHCIGGAEDLGVSLMLQKLQDQLRRIHRKRVQQIEPQRVLPESQTHSRASFQHLPEKWEMASQVGILSGLPEQASSSGAEAWALHREAAASPGHIDMVPDTDPDSFEGDSLTQADTNSTALTLLGRQASKAQTDALTWCPSYGLHGAEGTCSDKDPKAANRKPSRAQRQILETLAPEEEMKPSMETELASADISSNELRCSRPGYQPEARTLLDRAMPASGSRPSQLVHMHPIQSIKENLVPEQTSPPWQRKKQLNRLSNSPLVPRNVQGGGQNSAEDREDPLSTGSVDGDLPTRPLQRGPCPKLRIPKPLRTEADCIQGVQGVRREGIWGELPMEVAGQEQHLQELHEADSPVNRSAMFRHCTGQAPTIAQTTAVYATTVNQGLSMRAETDGRHLNPAAGPRQEQNHLSSEVRLEGPEGAIFTQEPQTFHAVHDKPGNEASLPLPGRQIQIEGYCQLSPGNRPNYSSPWDLLSIGEQNQKGSQKGKQVQIGGTQTNPKSAIQGWDWLGLAQKAVCVPEGSLKPNACEVASEDQHPHLSTAKLGSLLAAARTQVEDCVQIPVLVPKTYKAQQDRARAALRSVRYAKANPLAAEQQRVNGPALKALQQELGFDPILESRPRQRPKRRHCQQQSEISDRNASDRRSEQAHKQSSVDDGWTKQHNLSRSPVVHSSDLLCTLISAADAPSVTMDTTTQAVDPSAGAQRRLCCKLQSRESVPWFTLKGADSSRIPEAIGNTITNWPSGDLPAKPDGSAKMLPTSLPKEAATNESGVKYALSRGKLLPRSAMVAISQTSLSQAMPYIHAVQTADLSSWKLSQLLSREAVQYCQAEGQISAKPEDRNSPSTMIAGGRPTHPYSLPKDIQESQMPNMAQADLPCATQRNAIHALQPVSVALLGFSQPSLEAERLNVCPWQPTNLLEGGKLASCPAWPSKNRFLGLDMYQQTSLQHLLTMCDPSVPYLDPSHKGPVQTSQRECAANTLPQTAIKNSCNIVPAASGTPLVASTIKSPLCGTPLLSSRNNSRKLAIKCQLLDENLSVEYTHPQEQACREIPTTPKGLHTRVSSKSTSPEAIHFYDNAIRNGSRETLFEPRCTSAGEISRDEKIPMPESRPAAKRCSEQVDFATHISQRTDSQRVVSQVLLKSCLRPRQDKPCKKQVRLMLYPDPKTEPLTSFPAPTPHLVNVLAIDSGRKQVQIKASGSLPPKKRSGPSSRGMRRRYLCPEDVLNLKQGRLRFPFLRKSKEGQRKRQIKVSTRKGCGLCSKKLPTRVDVPGEPEEAALRRKALRNRLAKRLTQPLVQQQLQQALEVELIKCNVSR